MTPPLRSLLCAIGLSSAMSGGCWCLPDQDCSSSDEKCQACCDVEHGEGKREGWVEHRRTRMNGARYDQCVCEFPLTDDEKARLEQIRAEKREKRETKQLPPPTDETPATK